MKNAIKEMVFQETLSVTENLWKSKELYGGLGSSISYSEGIGRFQGGCKAVDTGIPLIRADDLSQ